MYAIETQGLSKDFESRVQPHGFVGTVKSLIRPQRRSVSAVRSLDIRVERGEITAFLGPNGAGKSTTIKMLTGILRPSAGDARVLGLVPWKDRTRLAFRIASVFGQKSQLWFHLPPDDSFELLAAIYEIDKKTFRTRRDELVERFALADLLHTPVRKLSLGQRIRCEIAASLLHDPEVLFLDEPTIGLDVVVKQEIRALLLEMNRERGTTILLTSHDIGDIEKMCKRAVIIHHGEIIVDEPVKRLKHQAFGKKIVGIKYAAPVNMEFAGISAFKVNADSTAASFEVNTREHRLPEFISALVARGEVADITIEDEPLESLIAAVFASQDRDSARAVQGGDSARKGFADET